MANDILLKMPIAFLPAVLLAIVLDRLDAFALVSNWALLRAMLAGAVLSAISYFANGRSLDGLPIGFTDYSRYVAPFVEEALKASFVIWLLWRNRIGFLVDAAILGFALGCGFAVFENGYYLWLVPKANVGVWLVRGFGTAVMHGAASALFAVIGQALTVRSGRPWPWLLLPGYFAAVAVHAAYNQFPNQPVLAMLGVLVIAPLGLLAVEGVSERSADRWLEDEHATHAQLLEALREERATGAAGRLVEGIRAQFRGAAADDALAYLHLHVALLASAEERLLAHEAGQPAPPAPDLEQRFARLHALERSLGRAGRRALASQLALSRRDLWELHLLEERSHANGRALSPGANPAAP